MTSLKKVPVAAMGRWVILSALLVAVAANGQELEPRAFSPGPTGMNIVAISTSYSSGDLVFDSSVPIEGATAKGWTGGVGYQRFFGLFGKTAKVAAMAAYADYNAKGYVADVYRERHFDGLADPRIAMSMIFAGAPAMTPQQYAKYRPGTLAGFSLSLSPPLGAYEKDKLLNAGMNRWTMRTQLGMSRYRGPWTLEATLGGQFFTDNQEYLGNSTQSQDPIYSVQAHAAYTVKPQLWVAMSAIWYRGGGATVDDVSRPGFQNNSRYGVSASVPLAPGQSLGINYSRGLFVKTGSNYDTLVVNWGVRWFDRKR